VRDKDLSEALGKWLAEPAQSSGLAGGLVSAVPAMLDALDDDGGGVPAGPGGDRRGRRQRARQRWDPCLRRWPSKAGIRRCSIRCWSQGIGVIEENKDMIRSGSRDGQVG